MIYRGDFQLVLACVFNPRSQVKGWRVSQKNETLRCRFFKDDLQSSSLCVLALKYWSVRISLVQMKYWKIYFLETDAFMSLGETQNAKRPFEGTYCPTQSKTLHLVQCGTSLLGYQSGYSNLRFIPDFFLRVKVAIKQTAYSKLQHFRQFSSYQCNIVWKFAI